MATAVKQGYELSNITMGANGAVTAASVIYKAFDCADETAACRAVLKTAPANFEGLVLDTVSVDTRMTETSWMLKANYVVISRAIHIGGAGEYDDDEPVFSFCTGDGKKIVTRAKQQTVIYGNKNPGGLVGWNGKTGENMQVNGVEIPSAAPQFTIQKMMNAQKLTSVAYLRTVAGLKGCVNSTQFFGWNPGEVMFMDMTFTGSLTASKISATYTFSVLPTERITTPDGHQYVKAGWDYTDFYYGAEVSEDPSSQIDTVSATVVGASINRVCEFKSFSELGLV